MPTLGILWNTFGLIGLASCLAWASAAVALFVGLLSRRRFHVWLAASGLALVGLALAAATSESIRGIEVDRSAEVLAAEEAAKKSSQDKLRGRAAGIRFAEDTASDQADIAGVSVAEEQGAYERAVEERLAKIPAYRSRGKQRRATTKSNATMAGPEPAGEAGGAEATDGTAADEKPAGRMLPESQLLVADRYDRINRGVAWSLFSFAVGLVGLEYLRRFNSTFDAVWPLPLAGTPLDGAMPKEHVVALPSPNALADFLAASVRKGESFIVFTHDDLLDGRYRLDRFSLGPVRMSLPITSFSADELAADRGLAELVFESAWFGRGGFLVLGEHHAGNVLAGILARLAARRHCRAFARRTLNLVWALSTPCDAAVAHQLEWLASVTNVRWIRPTAGERPMIDGVIP